MLLSLLLYAFAEETSIPPVDPEELRTWWNAAGEIRMGESAYRVDAIQFEEGVCSVELNGGVMIPVLSGLAPLSERMVGFLYIGDGALSVRFPERSDAWLFSNHMSRRANLSRDLLLPIARQEKPYTVGIDRGLFLSADPDIQRLRNNLNPIGGGLYYEETEEGEVDATYVVTEDSGKLGAQFVATNVLADRADYLERLGLDPRAILRQDRLLHDRLQIPGYYLRAMADFRTKQRFHVAAQEGTIVDTMNYDKWLTCFRDGRDESDTGFRSLAFAHGFDADKRRHFQRFSGERFPLDKNGDAVRSPLRMDAVFAESTVEFTPVRSAADQKITVESLLTLEAKGGDLQYVAMKLPTDGARSGTWEMEALELEDGRMLAWAGLNSSLRYGNPLAQMQGQLNNQLDNLDLMPTEANRPVTSNPSQDLSTDDGSNVTGGLGGGGLGNIEVAEEIAPEDPFAGTRQTVTEQNAVEQERDIFQQSGFSYKILAVLPEPVPKGTKVKIRVRWSAELPFANMRSLETAESMVVRTAGVTTGLRSYLPELLPAPGGTKWDFRTTVGAPSHYSLLRQQRIAASGDTYKTWQDEGLWNWIEVRGTSAIRPAVGVGRWKRYMEPQVKNMPKVRVNMFPKSFAKAKQFPAEVRRVITFMEKFLPSFPLREIEVVEDRSSTILASRYIPRIRPLPGLVKLRSFAVTAVGRTGQTRKESPHLAQEQIASQIASQYWGQLLSPHTSRDRWMSTVIPDAYANFYLRGVYGLEDYSKKMDTLRNRIEKPKTILSSWKAADAKKRSYSLSGSTPYSDVPKRARQDYGFYVFSEMLRLQVGNEAFFRALDTLAERLQKKRVNTERLQQILEKVSKRDLSDFFDFWIHGGYIPRFTVYTRMDEKEGKKTLYGCIESDLPYGILDVPIRIKQPQKETDTMIKVVHGYGSFIIPKADPKTDIVIDPLGLLLSFERLHKRVNKATPCGKDPLKSND